MTAYHQPQTLTDALTLLSGGGLTVAAGCTDLFPATEAPALPGPVLDIAGIAELGGIEETGAGWRIGAATTWSAIRAAALPPAFDMLKQAAAEVGAIQIQNTGTIGGNLCNASPAADGVPPLLALDAAVEIASAAERRTLPLADFITAPRRTALAPGELLTAVTIPRAAATGVSRFLKLGARRYLVISVAMVAARLVVEDGAIRHAAIAVGACGPVATRLTKLEAHLTAGGGFDPRLVTDALAPIDDIRADAAYRATAAAELARRAMAELT